MTPRRPSIPIQVLAFRHRRWRPRWLWGLAAALVALLLIWLSSRWSGDSTTRSPVAVNTAQVAGPPWQLGNPEGRFTMTLYGDLECPFCRSYFPLLKRWVGVNADVALQWQHMPLAAHEPAASAEARLAECAAEVGGHAAFGRPSNGSMPIRAATARACPLACAIPTSRPLSISAWRASGRTWRSVPRPRKRRRAA